MKKFSYCVRVSSLIQLEVPNCAYKLAGAADFPAGWINYHYEEISSHVKRTEHGLVRDERPHQFYRGGSGQRNTS